MSHLRMISARSFSNSRYPLWARVGRGHPRDALCIDSISGSDHYPDGTCLCIKFNNTRPNGASFVHSKKFYNFHIPLPFQMAFSACKDFRSVSFDHNDELNLTEANLPRLRAFYEDPEECGSATSQSLYGLLCLPYALHRFRI